MAAAPGTTTGCRNLPSPIDLASGLYNRFYYHRPTCRESRGHFGCATPFSATFVRTLSAHAQLKCACAVNALLTTNTVVNVSPKIYSATSFPI